MTEVPGRMIRYSIFGSSPLSVVSMRGMQFWLATEDACWVNVSSGRHIGKRENPGAKVAGNMADEWRYFRV